MRRIGFTALLLAGAVSLGAQPEPPQAADAAPQRTTMAFSDPSRPGSIEMSIVTGNIVVRGANRRDVMIEARATAGRAPRRRTADEPPPAGLRRLTQNAPFSVEEDRNTISIEMDSPVRGVDFVIEVPARTNLELETVMGSVSVEGVDGNIEIESVNGPVTLNNVGGSVVAHSVNGRLVATIARPTPQQPMAFTSMNGSVDVTLPPSVKANLRLRSDQGDVFTDFDLQVRPDSNPNPNPNGDARRNGRRRIEIDNAIYGSINGGGPDFEMRTFNGNVYVRKAK